jgi:hypothetical protein
MKDSLEEGRFPFAAAAVALSILMAVLMGGSIRRESVTFDEEPHIGAGLSYVQKLDLRMNPEHPPLAKVLAGVSLMIRGTHADYDNPSWTLGHKYIFGVWLFEGLFGHSIVTRWNDQATVLAWARAPMLLLTLALGWIVFVLGRRLGGGWGGLLCLTAYVTAPVFLAYGPLVLTDLAIALFSITTLWTFAELWRDPTRNKTLAFGLSLSAALLSKFSAGLLFFAFLAFALSTRWRAVPGQPAGKSEAREWRRKRWRATRVGIFEAAAVVYLTYFILSLREPTDFFGRKHGPLAGILLHLILPPLRYFFGVLIVAFTSSRETFLLGHRFAHGVPFYFPVLFVLKSAPGFLGLLVLALGAAVWLKRRSGGAPSVPVIPQEYGLHWRVLWTSLIFFAFACIAARLNIGYRHFSIPVVLLTLLLAPLPRMLGRLRGPAPAGSFAGAAAAVLLSLGCVFTALRAYPFYIPYVSVFSFGSPAYALVDRSNVDWNQSLPEVERFAEERGIKTIDVDSYSWFDPADTIPRARLWNCQTPSAADAGQWVVVSANFILDSHNCAWLMKYPHETLGGGSMYAVQLPTTIPAAGIAGGPPVPQEQRQFVGALEDPRPEFIRLINHPETIEPFLIQRMAAFAGAHKH